MQNTPISHLRSAKPDLMNRVTEESRNNNNKVPMNTESVETYGDVNIISDLDLTNEGKRKTISRIDFNDQTDNNSGIFLPPDKGSFAPSPDKIEMMEKYDNQQENDRLMTQKSIKFHNRG